MPPCWTRDPTLPRTCIYTLNVCPIRPLFSPHLSLSTSLPSLSFFYLFLSVYPSLSFSLSFSHRQQWQWFGAVDGASPARGAGSAAVSDQVYQEGASVSLSGLQERMSGCWDYPNHSSTIIMLYIDMNYSNNFSFFYLSWAGVPQWDGRRGDIQIHLFSVLSSRRLVKTSSLDPPLFCPKTKINNSRLSNIMSNTPPNFLSFAFRLLLQNTARRIYDPDSLRPQMQPHTLTSCSTHLT